MSLPATNFSRSTTFELSTSSAFSSSAEKVRNWPRLYSYPLTTSRFSISSPVPGSCGRSVIRVAAGLWFRSTLALSALKALVRSRPHGELKGLSDEISVGAGATQAWMHSRPSLVQPAAHALRACRAVSPTAIHVSAGLVWRRRRAPLFDRPGGFGDTTADATKPVGREVAGPKLRCPKWRTAMAEFTTAIEAWD